jgi:SAM-dependent methyltransferase
LSAADWLETHFEACRDEYVEMLNWVGIRRDWKVLDAGCGAGSFLPELASIVGPDGTIEALDPDSSHIAAIRDRFSDGWPGCRASATVGFVTDLPYESQHFDAVWCANVLQYLDDDQLRRALLELQRVVRRGGLVAVKDVDMLLARIGPGDACLMTRLADACTRGDDVAVQSYGSLRGRELRRCLESAGFVYVWQRSRLIERWAPLRAVELQLWDRWLGHLAEAARHRELPGEDRETWRNFEEPAWRAAFVRDPQFYACEGQVLAVGQVA